MNPEQLSESLGHRPRMFDVTVTVDRYNDSRTRVFKCKVINHKILTPNLLSTIIGGTATFLGELPPQYNVRYQVTINPQDNTPIKFNNISGSSGVAELSSEISNVVRLLMNNPFKTVRDEIHRRSLRNYSKGYFSLHMGCRSLKTQRLGG